MHIASIGIDLGKTTFHLVALGERSKVLVRKKFSRTQLLMFDLRGFRSGLRSLGPVDREMERLIFGYDFLVLIPHPAASHPFP